MDMGTGGREKGRCRVSRYGSWKNSGAGRPHTWNNMRQFDGGECFQTSSRQWGRRHRRSSARKQIDVRQSGRRMLTIQDSFWLLLPHWPFCDYDMKLKQTVEGGLVSYLSLVCCYVVSNSLQHRGLYPRLLCRWNSPGKNTGVGCHFLFWGIFLTQWLNLHLLHWQVRSNSQKYMRCFHYVTLNAHLSCLPVHLLLLFYLFHPWDGKTNPSTCSSGYSSWTPLWWSTST